MPHGAQRLGEGPQEKKLAPGTDLGCPRSLQNGLDSLDSADPRPHGVLYNLQRDELRFPCPLTSTLVMGNDPKGREAGSMRLDCLVILSLVVGLQ